jgi:transcriptional regulator with XRE-family HTH domain
MVAMNIAVTLRAARRRAGLTLRQLATLAGTSHSALASYESGAKVPRADTMARVLAAAGFAIEVRPSPNVAGRGRRRRGDELVDVLRLAALFPARHRQTLDAPKFGRLP